MNLVLYGNHSLDQLEGWAVSMFSGVENKNVTVPDLSEPVMAYNSENLGQVIRHQPILDKDSLSFVWYLNDAEFPWLATQWKSNPFSYFSHLIGHEGENSLLSYLKEEDYVMSLTAGNYGMKDWLTEVYVDITLTKKGLENTDKVTEVVFKYIQRLQEVGPQEWIFKEKNDIGNLGFNFIEKGDPFSYVTDLAASMSTFQNPEDMAQILRSSYVSDEYEPQFISQIASILADPAQCLIRIASKSFDDASLPIHEHWQNVNYSLEKMSEERLEQLRNPSVLDNGKRLDLPPANTFIATNFEILPEDQSLSVSPHLVQQWDNLADLWYKKDDKFKLPKAIVAAKIYTSDLSLGASPLTGIFSTFW